MITLLEKIDLYGLQLTFTTGNKKAFKSWIGGLFSIITFACMIAGIILFGQDFFNKTNPRVISQDKIPSTSEFVRPTSANYTIMYRLEDVSGLEVDLSTSLLNVDARYQHYKRNENNEWELVVEVYDKNTKCSETQANLNPNLPSLNLNDWYCVNWENIRIEARSQIEDKELASTYEPVLGGFWDENEAAYYSIDVNNLKTGSKDEYVDVKEITKELDKDYVYISLYYPTFSFNAESTNSPLNIFYENFYYAITSSIVRTDRNFFMIGKLIDDKGWIFVDEQEYSATTIGSKQIELSLLNVTEEAVIVDFYNFIAYFGKKQINLRRNYMKIQELAAVLGGFIKIVNVGFQCLAFVFTDHLRDLYFANKFISISENTQKQPDQANNQSGFVLNNYLSRKKEINISVFSRYINKVKKLKSLTGPLKAFEDAKNEVKMKMDLEYLLKHFEEFDILKKMVLNETQIEELEQIGKK